MAALCSLLNVYVLLQDFTLTERSELLELQRNFMLNIFVSALSNFFFCLDLNFKEKPLLKPHHFTYRMLAKLATFVIILVATIFSTRHGDQSGCSLEHCSLHSITGKPLVKPTNMMSRGSYMYM